jgi:hypothetical protein
MDKHPDRAYWENQATDARLRLERRLRALFERRRYWTAAANRVAHPRTMPLLVAALGLTAIALIAQRMQRRRRHGPRIPEVLALLRSQPVSEKGFLRQTLEKTARSLLSDAGRQLGRRGVRQLLYRSGEPRN